MHKTLIRVAVITSILILSIIYLTISFSSTFNNDYTSIVFNSKEEAIKGGDFLISNGFVDTLHLDNVTLPVNEFTRLGEMTLDKIVSKVDKNDYRTTPFISAFSKLFIDSFGNGYIFLKIDRSKFINYFEINNILKRSGLDYKWSDPSFLRLRLNLLALLLIFVVISYGSLKRGVISFVLFVLSLLFVDLTQLYSYLGVLLLYPVILYFFKAYNFNNLYKRLYITILLFILPTVLPTFLQTFFIVNSINSTEFNSIDYSELEATYEEGGYNISNFYTHYAYQKSFLYGRKYLFPKDSESITIEEFDKVDYFLIPRERVVMEFDKNFYYSFLSYCKTTSLGRFYLDLDRPFRIIEKTFIYIYIKNKEYMQICILAVIMLFTSFLLYGKKIRIN